MTDHHIAPELRALKLGGMADEYVRQQTLASAVTQPFSDRLIQMIHAENDARADRKRARLLSASQLHHTATPEDLVYSIDRGLDESQIKEMQNCNWIRHGHNATIVGATGSGKSYLAMALGRAAIRQGIPVRYYRAHLLLEDVEVARVDGSIRKLRTQLRKYGLLILDEFGLHELNDQAKEDLLDILEERVGRASTIVVGQRAISEWHDFIGRPLMADAILDRILHHSYNINLRGKSLRERKPPTL